MSEKSKSVLFGLMFAIFGVSCLKSCLGDATLILFRSIQIRGFLLDAYLFVLSLFCLYISYIFFKSVFKK